MAKRKTEYQKIQEERRKQRELMLELQKARLENDNSALQSPPPKPLTRWEKVKNFFYYYKYRMLTVVLVIAVVVLMVYQIANKPKYDCNVVLFLNETVTNDVSEQFAKELQNYCPDANGDGKVLVQVINCSVSDEDSLNVEFMNAQVQKFAAQFSLAENQLFILGGDLLEVFNQQYKEGEGLTAEDKQSYWDSTLQLPAKDGTALDVSGSPLDDLFRDKYGVHVPDGMFLLRRNMTYVDASDKKIAQHTAASLELLQNLCKAEAYNK